MTNPYFLPDEQMRQALLEAKRRGVRVVLLLPGAIDNNIVRQASRGGFGELLDAGIELASTEGMFVAPEGAACVAALVKLIASGFLKREERIVIYNTGAGLKYLEAYSTRFPRAGAGEQDKLGGLITPR